MAGVIHVGAWTGQEYIGVPGPLLLIEPQSEAFAVLKSRFRARKDVKVVNVAIGAEAGEAVIHTAIPSHSSSLLKPLRSRDDLGIYFEGEELVKVAPLDAVVNGAHYDTLRVDTQGYELIVLEGATETLRQVRRVEIEIHDPTAYAGAASLEQVDDWLSV